MRGARGSGSTAWMEATGRLNWPGLKCGFSWPSYSNLPEQYRVAVASDACDWRGYWSYKQHEEYVRAGVGLIANCERRLCSLAMHAHSRFHSISVQVGVNEAISRTC